MDLWDKLLAENLKQYSNCKELAWTYREGEFVSHECMMTLSTSDFSAAIVREDVEFNLVKSNKQFSRLTNEGFYMLMDDDLDEEVKFFLKNYWTLIMHIQLNRKDLPFVLVHMASSLDGKIATNNGHSKWIGNQENLVHAHRLRAIVEGILVGAATVRNDSPQLNVRHVDGPNPIRLILSNTTKDFAELGNIKQAKTYLLRNKEYQNLETTYPFHETIYFEGELEEDRLKNLLLHVRKSGIRSILIEGGPITVSNFLEAGLVNLLQIHVAPLILGSGRDFVRLPEIATIEDGIFMKNLSYSQMGDSMMITGNV